MSAISSVKVGDGFPSLMENHIAISVPRNQMKEQRLLDLTSADDEKNIQESIQKSCMKSLLVERCKLKHYTLFISLSA